MTGADAATVRGRPKTSRPPMISTGCRLPAEVHAQVVTAAEERGWQVQVLIRRAVEDYLARLVPADEIVWTRDGGA